MSPAIHKRSISVIGSGRLGSALALALSRRGYVITAVVARRQSHARKAAALIGQTPDPMALSAARIQEIPQSDIYLFTTPDSVIPEVAARLSSAQPFRERRETNIRSPVAIHASGALSSIILRPLRDIGWQTASMHPMVSISDPVAGASSFNGAYFCIEGDRGAAAIARAMVRRLGGRQFSVPAACKPLYHAAAVMSSGHVVALVDLAIDILTACGLTPAESRQILTPLVRSAIDNLEASEPARALTGSFARADVDTVKRHLAALAGRDKREAREVYINLGRHALSLAKAAGAPPDRLKRIRRMLAGESGGGDPVA